MLSDNKLIKLLQTAEIIEIDTDSKIVLLSDQHRGDGTSADKFASNQNAFMLALHRYEQDGYTYIELGDSDEMWSNRRFRYILDIYSNIFRALGQMYSEGRYFAVYGNHDMVKANPKWVEDNLSSYHIKHTKQIVPLFPDIKIHEAIILRMKDAGRDILLIHGHQVDPLNSTFWRLARFLVRYFWRPLELLGLKDPTSASHNNKHKAKVDAALADIAERANVTVIAGHTHQAIFDEDAKSIYFNDGSCVHPRFITAIEISDGRMHLVKWGVQVKESGALVIERTALQQKKL